MKLNESTLRDNLAKNITAFFPNLEVIKTEYNIPNVRGTRGSIDILAKDTEGCYVIIELKRSNQAAREAIHEVHKYIEGLKENLKTKDSEIKVYIVSTEWKELIIPFSSFKRDNHFTVEGFLIEINDKFEPTKCELVVPIKLNSNRLFSPIQSCRMYENEANLNKGIKECVYCLNTKKMKDFVLVILKAPDISKQEYVAYLNDIMESVSLDNDFEFSPIDENKITMNKFMIYEGFIRQSYETYLDILNTNKPLKDETLESLQYIDNRPDSKLEILENSVINLSPYPYTDYFEEGNPAKFQKITEQENWVILKILRYGSLENNHLLQDETIIKELKGHQGNNNVIYKNSMPTKHKAKLREIKTGISECLYYNKTWRAHFDIIFDYYKKKDDIFNYSLDIALLTPNNILLSLYYEITRDKKGYIPFYKLKYKFFEPEKSEKNYLGMFIWNGKKPNFKKICKKYYQGDSFQLVVPMIWGGHENRNNEILDDLGLIYSTWLEVIKEGEETQYFILEDYKFKKIIPKKHNYLFINSFIANNTEFIENLVAVINKHSHGDNNEIISM